MEQLTFGPAGGLGGEPFNDYVLTSGATLTQIHVYADAYIDAIQLFYTASNGRSGQLPRIGGLGGVKQAIILASDETIVEISGTYGWYIDQLTIKTNKQTYGPYGGSGGSQSFKLVVPPGRTVTGLFGRAAWYVDAIGLITGAVKIATPAAPPKPKAKPAAKPKAKPKAAKPKASKPKAKQVAKTSQPKDLQKVEGIGPKIASLLIADGILDLEDLSKAKVADIQAVLDKAGSRYRIANPETWPEQAALGAKGDWDGMKALQETLKGGRRK